MSDGRWVTTTEAAQRLGVKRATLYAYVSRGLLHSERRPGQQESLFERAEIDALAVTSRASGSPQPLLRFRSVASSVSRQRDGDLLYRGVSLADVVAGRSFEEAAALVLGGTGDVGQPAGAVAEDGYGIPADLARRLIELPLPRRLPLAVQWLAALDPLTADVDPDRARLSAARAVRWGVNALRGGSSSGPQDVPTLLLGALTGATPSRADAELMRVLLTSLLDHGLTASTIAARVAASTRASLLDCLGAGYAALSGPLHGAAPAAARSLLDDPAPAALAVANSMRSFGRVPGFGHFLYPDGDPRAEIVLAALWSRRGTTRLRRKVDSLAAAVAGHSGDLPNIDLAGAAVLHALKLPPTAGEVVFQVARSYGIAAHVIEEYAEAPLRWRGREAVG